MKSRPCPVCGGATTTHDVVDFNKSCEEARGRYLPPANVAIEYARCEECGFCFAPAMLAWKLEEFASKVYNDQYVQVDPDYLEVRPRGNAQFLDQTFRAVDAEIRHLDYGGGNGLLSGVLLDRGWQSTSYDVFVDRDIDIRDFGSFDLITAFEVFEHVPDPAKLVTELASLLDASGIVLFSTFLTDGQIVAGQPLRWWYASPRNGHISLYSRDSLSRLGEGAGFRLHSFSDNLHAYWRSIPAWAKHIFPPESQ